MGVEGRDVSREGERHKVDVGRVVNIAAVWLDECINDYIYIIRIPLDLKFCIILQLGYRIASYQTLVADTKGGTLWD